MYTALYNNYGGHGDYYKRWQNPGDELTTNVPAMVYPGVNVADQYYLNSEVLVSKGDHIRLQDINLSYNLDSKYHKSFILKTYVFLAM
ncbi:hypothetical protein ACFOEQ_00395 [Chryseobacterium arachidis]|uniref:hypothetical protein n=1 Tax=Chryseobacterium arachidis TaxID=1416778 RepID=UPI00361162F0